MAGLLGDLVSVYSYMNLQLASTEEYIDGQFTGNLGEVLIRFATQNKASGACQTGKREVEACQKHPNDKVNSAVSDISSIPQKGSTNIAEAKKKYFPSGEKISPMFIGEKRSHANTVTELGKKSASRDKKYHDS